jgi:hypothetical protein
MKCAICEREYVRYGYQAINGTVICKNCVLDVIANKDNFNAIYNPKYVVQK